MTSELRFVDRSRIVTDWKCPMSRFWGYEYLGKGLSSEHQALPLALGIAVHDSLATIATYHKEGKAVPIDDIADLAFRAVKQQLLEATNGEVGADDFANEQASLVEGQVRGFYRWVWPRLMAQYPVILAVEQEVEYKLDDNLVFMAKPDLLMQSEGGEVVYIEYKTTSSKSTEWINSWNTAVQLHSSIKAVEQTMGVAPTLVQIVGLYKGYYSHNKQNSPWCYAYHRAGNPPFSEDQLSYEYKTGWKRKATIELEGGIKKWVEDMPDEVIGNLFPMTPPIMVNDDLVEAFFRQVETRELEIANTMGALKGILGVSPGITKEVMDTIFPQRFDQCQPSFGSGCQFKSLCHGRVTDPLKMGFVFRTPHHQAEMDQWEASNEL